MTRVLIVDDQPLVRSAVRGLLSGSGIEVVGEAADGVEALTQARSLHPDVVLMDIRMPTLDGIATTRELCSDPTMADSRVLILTTFEEDEYVLAALRAGASGFIGKGAEPEEIARAVLATHEGESLLSPRATQTLIERYLTQPAPTSPRGWARPVEPLTAREQEILVLVAGGLSNQEIADDLVISPYTVKTHVNRVMVKLGARDRAQLVIYAYETGAVQPGSPLGKRDMRGC